MKKLLSLLCLKIWRIWRKEFFLKHLHIALYTIVWLCIFFMATFLICWDGNDSFACKWILRFLDYSLIIIPILYIISIFYLAKRFQDCWICGVRAFIICLIFPIILVIVLSQLYSNNWVDLLYLSNLFYPILLCLYLIVFIIMCFVKWNPGPNKYGNPV